MTTWLLARGAFYQDVHSMTRVCLDLLSLFPGNKTNTLSFLGDEFQDGLKARG